jgi:hypothetical protein
MLCAIVYFKIKEMTKSGGIHFFKQFFEEDKSSNQEAKLSKFEEFITGKMDQEVKDKLGIEEVKLYASVIWNNIDHELIKENPKKINSLYNYLVDRIRDSHTIEKYEKTENSFKPTGMSDLKRMGYTYESSY